MHVVKHGMIVQQKAIQFLNAGCFWYTKPKLVAWNTWWGGYSWWHRNGYVHKYLAWPTKAQVKNKAIKVCWKPVSLFSQLHVARNRDCNMPTFFKHLPHGTLIILNTKIHRNNYLWMIIVSLLIFMMPYSYWWCSSSFHSKHHHILMGMLTQSFCPQRNVPVILM